jgi:hypothetical protein
MGLRPSEENRKWWVLVAMTGSASMVMIPGLALMGTGSASS